MNEMLPRNDVEIGNYYGKVICRFYFRNEDAKTNSMTFEGSKIIGLILFDNFCSNNE